MLRTGQLHRAPPRPRNLARRRRPRYRGPWRLPGPDSHRLAAVSLSLGYVVVLLLSVLLGARATGRTFLRNRCGERYKVRISVTGDQAECQRGRAVRRTGTRGGRTRCASNTTVLGSGQTPIPVSSHYPYASSCRPSMVSDPNLADARP